MSKIAWITDSTCYMEPELIEKHKIHVIPLSVIFGDKSYREGIDIQADQFYEMLKTQKELPKTSQPSVGEIEELYQELAKTYDKGIAVHLSSGVSGTYFTSKSAAELVGFPVAVIDSEIATYPMAYMLLEGIEMEQQGKSYEEIVARLEELPKRFRAYFLVDDLGHLHRGGRLNAAQFIVGSMLQIKPILYLQDKKIVRFEKIRTYKKAKSRVLDLFHEDAQTGEPMRVSILHGNIPEEANAWKEEIEAKYPHIQVHVTVFGPVIATHLGPGSIGLTWYKI